MKKFLLILLCCPLFTIKANAEDFSSSFADDIGKEQMEEMLSEQELEISGELSFDGSYDAGGALARLWRSFIAKVAAELKNNLSYVISLTALAFMCSFTAVLCGSGKSSVYAELICCASAALMMLDGMDSIINQTLQAVYRLSDYSKAALPVVFTAAAAGGAVSSAAAKFAAVSFSLDVLMSMSQKMIIPLVQAFLALSTANAMFPNPMLNAVQKFFKWAATTVMTAMTIAFTTYMGMIGAIGSAVDTAAVKTARSFISGTLPVIGSMISDASAMLLSAAGVVKSCSGVFGLIAVCIMCAAPFALLSVKMLVFKFAAAVSDSLQCSRLNALFSGLGNSMALLLGLLGSSGIMLFISLTAGMKAVNI